MIILNINNILKDEKKFNSFMEELSYAYDILKITKPIFISKKPIEIEKNEYIKRQLEEYIEDNNKSKYKKIIQKASELEFKEKFKIEYSSYKKLISKIQNIVNDEDSFNIITELKLNQYKENPQLIEITKKYINEVIKDLDLNEKTEYSPYIMAEKVKKNMLKLREGTQKDNNNFKIK